MKREFAYPLFVVLTYAAWLWVMSSYALWSAIAQWWQLSVTMVFGSFVAGSTATGGSAVAFPVFTKMFDIPSEDARMFGLMIQSFGMTAASFFIWSRRIRILNNVVVWTCAGSLVGMLIAIHYLTVHGALAKILFTSFSSVFGLVLIWSHWFMKKDVHRDIHEWGGIQRLEFFCIGIIGGICSESTGCGADMVTFVILSLVYRIDERVSVPTTVVVMALTSLLGFFVHGVVMDDIGPVWEYWLACVPIVVLGAPLGVWLVTRISRTQIVLFLCSLILADLISSILLINMDSVLLQQTVTLTTAAACFFALLLYRGRYV